ncbi:MAG: hypothetical protein LBG47_00760 [Prevotellaceae bacterium]|nr:hypothetical protein [Prevotellaceae bacterium]
MEFIQTDANSGLLAIITMQHNRVRQACAVMCFIASAAGRVFRQVLRRKDKENLANSGYAEKAALRRNSGKMAL